MVSFIYQLGNQASYILGVKTMFNTISTAIKSCLFTVLLVSLFFNWQYMTGRLQGVFFPYKAAELTVEQEQEEFIASIQKGGK